MEKAQKALDALNAYKNKMIDASQLRRAINQRFSSELRALRAEKDRVGSFESEELPRSMNNMFYYSLRTGNATAYGAKHLFLSDQISAAHLHRNRHYQWVLAEAYEGFEDFLESIYAAVGFAELQSLRKRILRSARANQCANDLELCICQAAVTSVVGTNIDDMALKASFNGVGDICKYHLDVSLGG